MGAGSALVTEGVLGMTLNQAEATFIFAWLIVFVVMAIVVIIASIRAGGC